jgi:hypothetical protein
VPRRREPHLPVVELFIVERFDAGRTHRMPIRIVRPSARAVP